MAGTANSIITPQSPREAVAVTSTATSAAPYTAPTNTAALLTVGANGGRYTRLRSRPRNTVTATVLLLFVSYDAGVTKSLIDSVLMSAYTAAVTTLNPGTDWGYSDDNPLILGPNAVLYVAQTVTMADGIVTEIEGSDY